MRAERFGVVLDCRHRRRNIALVALEVDDPVGPLVAAAAPPRGDLSACLLRPPVFLSGSVSGLYGSST